MTGEASASGLRTLDVARRVFAAAAAVVSGGIAFAYYLPGWRDNTDWLGLLMVLGPVAAAMAMPFVLLGAFVRVAPIWIPIGLLMLGITVWTGMDLLLGEEGGDGTSLLVFAFVFATDMILVVLAIVVDLFVRAALRRRHRRPVAGQASRV